MIRNYFKIAFRHLQKNKLYTSVNILGLVVGITSCILIGVFIWHEVSYDRFHEKKFFYADSAFFSVFSFPLISGDPEKVLNAPDKMVITQTMAKKYFGNE